MIETPEKDWVARLDEAFERAMRPFRDGRSRGLLFSGGVDSALLAWELKDSPDLGLSTVGVAGSPDLAAARETARQLGLPWVGVEVGLGQVRESLARVDADLEGLEPVAGSVLASFAVAIDRAPSAELLCGQGADELFLGYAHFRDLAAGAAGKRAEVDLARLLDRDWPRAQQIALRFSKTVSAPYLDPDFIAAARRIPIETRQPEPTPKAFFRRWAIHRGLPPEIARRPKRALQYGSGIDRLLRRGT